MAVSLDQFLAQVSLSGLLTPEQAAALAERTKLDPQTTVESVVRQLVRDGRLTAYQAQQFYAGKGRGLVLGNYVILERLGQGGMGTVYKARHRRMDRLVALKVLKPDIVKTPELLARFQREVKAAARLEHPNIVAAYDADEARGTHFFVMQYIDGQDLATLLKTRGPLDPATAVGCVMQAARGLEFAHRNGVIHRDIKPANLLLDRQGVLKILDMGLARIDGEVSSQHDLTTTGAVMGTVDYMAPEQAMSTRDADARSDIYSLGATLWQLLVGRPMFSGDSLMARLIAHREAPIPSLREALAERTEPRFAEAASVVERLDSVFRKMVAKQPADRYQTMAEVLAALPTFERGDQAPIPGSLRRASEDSNFDRFVGGLAARIAPATPIATTSGTPHETAAIERSPSATLQTSLSELGTTPSLPNISLLAGSQTRRPPRGYQRWGPMVGGLVMLLASLPFLLPRSPVTEPKGAPNVVQTPAAGEPATMTATTAAVTEPAAPTTPPVLARNPDLPGNYAGPSIRQTASTTFGACRNRSIYASTNATRPTKSSGD